MFVFIIHSYINNIISTDYNIILLSTDENNESRRKFTTEYLDLYQLSNNVTSINEPRICLRANFPWILEPNTDFVSYIKIIDLY